MVCVVVMHDTSICKNEKSGDDLQHRLGWWRVRVMWATRTWCPFVSNDPFSFESYSTPFQPKNPCLCASWLLFDSNEKENTRVFVIEIFGGTWVCVKTSIKCDLYRESLGGSNVSILYNKVECLLNLGTKLSSAKGIVKSIRSFGPF